MKKMSWMLFCLLFCKVAMAQDPKSWIRPIPNEDAVKMFAQDEQMQTKLARVISVVQKFVYAAQHDLRATVLQYGGKKLESQVQSLTEPVAKTFSNVLKHALPGSAQLDSDTPVFSFYDPFSDFLMITKWSLDGNLIECEYTTGNHVREKAVFNPLLSDEFKGEPTMIGASLTLFRRVQNKLFEFYPQFGKRAGDATGPTPTKVEDLETANFLFLNIAKAQFEYHSTNSSKQLDAFSAFHLALADGNKDKIQSLLSGKSTVSLDQIYTIPVAYRQNLQAFKLQRLPEGQVSIIAASPAYPAIWFDFQFNNEGKLFFLDYYAMNSSVEY